MISERLTEDEARSATEAPPAAAPAAPPSAPPAAPTGPVPVSPAPVGDGWGPASTAMPSGAPVMTMAPSAAPVVAPRPSLPVVAPRPRRRFSDLWRLVFSRRRAGRHRPETTPPHSWGMISPQRRRRRRWGRR
ncbi:hypothetical protein GCM10023204_17810 [Actinomycetospora succinea]